MDSSNNFDNNHTPFKKPLYLPSEFVPLGYSSPISDRQNVYQRNQNKRFYNDKNLRISNSFGYNRQQNRAPFYRKQYPKQQYQNSRNFNTSRPKHYNNTSRNNSDIESYFHPSMLEDPWKELIERNQSLNEANPSFDMIDISEPEASTSTDNSTFNKSIE